MDIDIEKNHIFSLF